MMSRQRKVEINIDPSITMKEFYRKLSTPEGMAMLLGRHYSEGEDPGDCTDVPRGTKGE